MKQETFLREQMAGDDWIEKLAKSLVWLAGPNNC